MTPELRKYYEDRLDMMGSQGWKDLMEDVQAMKDANDTVKGLDDLRKLGVRQGEVSMMDWLLGLRQISEETFEELKADENVA